MQALTQHTKKPSLTMFAPSLSAGGLENVFITLINGLSEAGWQVNCVVMRGGGAFQDKLPPETHLTVLDRRAVSSVGPMIRYLKAEQPDYILAFSETCNIVALLARRFAGMPTRVIVTVHSLLSLRTKHTHISKEKLYPFFVRRLYPAADRVVAVSHSVAHDLVSYTGLASEMIDIIYNPIPIVQIQAQAVEPLDHPWFTDTRDPIILSVGRLEAPKDFHTLIRAFAAVRENHNARLCIVGDGSQMESLRELVKALELEADVYLAGFDANPFKYMHTADVFVLSSRYEGFGNVLVEALACGCNIVSTDCPGGPHEILEDGRYGRLTPVGDVNQMADTILNALQFPMERSILQQRAAVFDETHAIDAYDRLLRQLDVYDR